jgi:hypothetical protein
VFIKDNLYVSGNVEILGSSSLLTLSASQVEIGTNTIILNTYSPFERFGGISVIDSGSAGGTGSLWWDSIENHWVYEHPADSGAPYNSAMLIAGPKNTGSLGNEQGLTTGYFPIASGTDHIDNSLLRYTGTTLAFNSNKFTVESVSGNTVVAGTLTVSTNGSDLVSSTRSNVTFKNANNIFGEVPTTDTSDVASTVLGYRKSDGQLIFTNTIDGGSF